MSPLLLGLDVSPRRLGWALVDLVSGEPVACGCEAIELPKNGWDRGRIAEAFKAVDHAPWNGLDMGDAWRLELRGGTEIQAVYVEHPISRFPGMAYDEGRAVGILQAEVQRRWPHAPVEYLKPSEWRLLAGLKGNASKAEVAAKAFDLQGLGSLMTTGWDGVRPDLSQDAADALLIAVAGQRRNGENWSRAVERGEAA